MSSIFESLIDTHLDQWVTATDRSNARESLIDLVNESIKAYVDHTYRDLVAGGPPPARPAKAAKPKTTAVSAPTLENPAEATSSEDLARATIQTLAKFCKERGLKVGGRKEEVVARAWRFLQGENSDEDRTPARRPKASTTKAVTTPHLCSATTRAGTACILAGTAQAGECWYCWKHDPARATTSAPSPATSASEPERVPGDAPSDTESVTGSAVAAKGERSDKRPKGERKPRSPKEPKGESSPKESKPKKTPKVIALEESD